MRRADDSPATDFLSLGEVMLRLDPGEERIRNASRFDVRIGGGEFNVAAGMSSCFGVSSGVVSALADNEVGHLIHSQIRAAGVDTTFVHWRPDGGTGSLSRNGVNFTERGFGLRPPLGVSDRANSAAALLKPGDIDWDRVFTESGAKWLHTGGVFSALSNETAAFTLAAVEAAHDRGVTVSYDVNFRPSLFSALGDRIIHSDLTRQIFEHVDVLVSNEPEFRLTIGEEVPSGELPDGERFQRFVDDASRRFPNIGIFAATQRRQISASRNDWGAIAWSENTGFVHGRSFPGLEILDRIGGGDAFVAGFAYGILNKLPLARALEIGIAHGALVMTTPGDLSAASLSEVMSLANGAPLMTIR